MDKRARDDEVNEPVAKPLTDSTTIAIREALEGRRHGLALLLPFAGPAIVVSVAYVDPGNFATNIQAGARYGYALLWVVVVANLIAMLFQALAAKLGIVTEHNLAELCREHFPKPVVLVLWVISEVAAMATDLAEFVGGALGLSLLLHVPLLVGMVIVGIATYGFLLFQKNRFRPLEHMVGAMVGVIGLCYLVELFVTPINWAAALPHLFVPELPDSEALTIAVGIIGATVMPHALFLHSGLTESRAPVKNESERAKLLRYSNIEVTVALAVAGLINIAMVLTAAGAFHAGHPEVAEIQSAYHTLAPVLGKAAAAVFLLSLVASGLSSSVVGTAAGQMIMQGFVGFGIPIWLRRAITMIPSFIVVGLGINATQALVVSQVILSFALPFPVVALVWFTSRQEIMGRYRNRAFVAGLTIVAALLVLTLNVVLLLQICGVPIPGMKS
ncbi:Nramp family divalent metal transporter [Paraburkholderia sp. DHOC27]|uniref:Nramp family divalent metal transporter n=1 Tax=Paraburkholderia sp. DHOC27 TaxID=2303330 RepID=UPI000E3CC736|nr:Nramp family divalent metal transporter [Paraburkholderia sp. DHOC27]RFU44300.1 divalent metal cation transporter [Paraburkholderia sp. DHOC27]